MDQAGMIAVAGGHLGAEGAGDVEGAVAAYTDVVHDTGFPGSPRTAAAAIALRADVAGGGSWAADPQNSLAAGGRASRK